MEETRYILIHTSKRVHTLDCPHVRPTMTTVPRRYVEDVFPDYTDCKTCGGCGGA